MQSPLRDAWIFSLFFLNCHWQCRRSLSSQTLIANIQELEADFGAAELVAAEKLMRT